MFGKKSVSARPIKVLYDGWPLVCSSAGENNAALHLLELLTALPENIDPWLALPGALPSGINTTAQIVSVPGSNAPAARLQWEQMKLPGLARRIGAHLIHTTSTDLPVFSPVPCLVSPVKNLGAETAGRGFTERLRKSLGQGGLSNAAGIQSLPPLVHPAFYAAQALGEIPPVPFILVPGPLDRAEIDLLCEVWRWVSASLDDEWLLLVSDLQPSQLSQLQHACEILGLDAQRVTAQIKTLALPAPQMLATAFQQARLVLQVGQVRPWGDALLQALACGRPIVGVETPWSDARVGPAGYLMAERDPRSLGAAVLTLITEEAMADRLSQAALQRAKSWERSAEAKQSPAQNQTLSFKQGLGAVYEKVVNGS